MSKADPASRVALVSGGNRGIGLAICRGLAELGVRVAVGSRDAAAGAGALAELGAAGERGMTVPLDVTSAASVRDAIAQIDSRWGRIDVLVNNAGVYLDESMSGVSVPIEIVQQTLDTNLVGALRLCQAVIPGMRQRRFGRIVNVSSGYGALQQMDSGGVLAYKVSKLGLNAVTRILAAELQGSGVLVNAMDPGWVRTRMGGRSAHRTPEQGADTAVYLATLPSGGPSGRFLRDRGVIPW